MYLFYFFPMTKPTVIEIYRAQKWLQLNFLNFSCDFFSKWVLMINTIVPPQVHQTRRGTKQLQVLPKWTHMFATTLYYIKRICLLGIFIKSPKRGYGVYLFMRQKSKSNSISRYFMSCEFIELILFLVFLFTSLVSEKILYLQIVIIKWI